MKAHAEAIAAEVGIDPLTVLAVISALLPIVQACLSTPESAERYFRQDTKATRRAIRRACDSAWRQRHKCNAPKRLVLAMQHRLATGDSGLYRAMYAE